MTKTILLALLLSGVMIGSATPAGAQSTPADSLLPSLEDLMDVHVTSVARRSQRAEDAPAAIYVITRHDIRQSGLTLLPEILRLAPGVQVARLGASQWAVSIRGFNFQYSNKLLVLIDGRSVYTRGFSGVFWDMQDLMVQDIDRIEIIRGPGGAMWGANAVNGVINIVTRPASDTQGVVAEVAAGTFEHERTSVRYGGTRGNTAYRVFSQWSGFGGTKQVESTVPSDRWHSMMGGARVDWSRGTDALLVQGLVTTARTRPGVKLLTSLDPAALPFRDGVSRGESGSVQGRWTRTSAAGTVLQIQGFHSTFSRDETVITALDHTNDIDVQYETAVGSRQGVIFGGGFRQADISTDSTLTLQMGTSRLRTFNLFLQDEIAAVSDVSLTLGAKVEHDTFAGWGLMPSARVLWTVSPAQRLWAAASRTRRTPAMGDRELRLNAEVLPGPGLPIVVAFVANPDSASEQFTQLEGGYRIRLASKASVEATVFTGAYDGLPTLEPFEPSLEMTPAPMHLLAGATVSNLLRAWASGIEVNGQWQPLPQWQLDGSYTRLHLTGETDPASQDTNAANTDGSAPGHQWQVRSTFSVRPGVHVGAWVSRVGRLRVFNIPAYTRLDARAEFRLSSRLTAAAVAQNLLTAHHGEFFGQPPGPSLATPGVPRSLRVELRWTN
ncbi:MAG: TonB-dependent receptor [Vicinamibacterales bacterium]